MLIKISGGRSGICEYLASGIKAGREYTRNDLDERVVLDGNFELTETLLNSINNEGENYLHITLAFKEDDLNSEQLKAIVADFKADAMRAYGADEFNFYAEAHIPRIKSYRDRKTGEQVIRKPHIHIVIPRRNLATGKVLDPFGRVAANIKFINAIQEHINHKYGLASPKEHPRIGFTDASEVLSRAKGDVFKNSGRHLKADILKEIIDRNVCDQVGLLALAREYGSVDTPKSGDKYLTVRPEGGKAVRLKGEFFTDKFLALTHAEKLARDQAARQDLEADFVSAKTPTRTPAEINATRKEWLELRAAEVRYINSGNKAFYAKYVESTREQKLEILKDQAHADQARRQPTQEQNNEHRAERNRREPPPAARGRMRHLSELHVVRVADHRQVLLQDHVPGELEHSGAKRNHDVRRPGYRQPGTDRQLTGTVPAQYLKNIERDWQQQQAEQTVSIKDITGSLKGEHFLASLADSNGLIASKYKVTQGKDGADRIQVGTKNLSYGDFLTKHLGLSWPRAEKLIREIHSIQLSQAREPLGYQPPHSELWQEYLCALNEAKSYDKADSAAARHALLAANKARRAAISATYKATKQGIEGNSQLTRVEKRAAVSIARMERVKADMRLRDQIVIEREALKTKQRKGKAAALQYADFLRVKAQGGDASALAELRKVQVSKPKIVENNEGISADREEQHAGHFLFASLGYRINNYGDVTYSLNGQDAVKDAGKTVHVLNRSEQTIEVALRLSIAKFGKQKLDVFGSEEFRRRTAELAARASLRVEFASKDLQNIYESNLAQRHHSGVEPVNREIVQATPDAATDMASNELEAKQTDKESATPTPNRRTLSEVVRHAEQIKIEQQLEQQEAEKEAAKRQQQERDNTPRMR